MPSLPFRCVQHVETIQVIDSSVIMAPRRKQGRHGALGGSHSLPAPTGGLEGVRRCSELAEQVDLQDIMAALTVEVG